MTFFRASSSSLLSKPAIQALVAGVVLFFSCSEPRAPRELDVPYVPTPQVVVDRMLDMAEAGEGDYLIDLGSGDGRIVISAALRGAKGHGIDLDPKRVREAEIKAGEAKVRDRVIFLEQDIFEAELRHASIITMYLLSRINMRLRPRILEELRPGTRIVSHRFDMGDWKADAVEKVDAQDGLGDRTIYYWVVPARVEGIWRWVQDGEDYQMKIVQHFQKIEVELSSPSRGFEILDTQLEGPRLSITAESGLDRYIFYGAVQGDTIEGLVQVRDRDTPRVAPWSARR